MSALTGAVQSCRRGRSRVAVVRGPAGIGKSALLQAFIDACDEQAVILFAAGSRVEADLPFGVLGQLFHSARLPSHTRDTVLRLSRTEPLPAPEGMLDRAHFRILDELVVALLEIAAETPVVLVVDDMHVADHASQQALHFIERRVRFSRVAIVVTELAGAYDVFSDFRAEMIRYHHTTPLTLGPLSQDSVARLLVAADDSTEADDAQALHAATGGSPMLVTALLADRAASPVVEVTDADLAVSGEGRRPDAAADRVPAGHEFLQSVLACLRKLGPQALLVAQSVALFGLPPGARIGNLATLVGKHVGLDTPTASRLIAHLEAAGLLCGAGFRHPAARDVTLRTVPDADRARRRERAAAVLFYAGAQQSVVADVLTEVDRVEEAWALRALRRAADEDVFAGRLDLALRRLGICIRSSTDEAERAELTLVMMRVEFRRNPTAAAHHLPPLTAACNAGLLGAGEVAKLVGFLAWFGKLDELTCLRSALETAASGSSVPWTNLLYPQLGGEGERSHPDTALAGGPGRALLGHLLTGAARRRSVLTAERTLQSSRLEEHTFDELLAALAVLLNADRPERAGKFCDGFLAELRGGDSPTWLALLLSVRAEVALREGDLPDAAAWVVEALDTMPADGWGVAVGGLLATAVAVYTAMGQHDVAAAHLRTPLPDGFFDTIFGPIFLTARGQHQLALGQAEAALGSFVQCGELVERWGIDQPALVPWRTGAAQAQMMLGERDVAGRLARAQLERSNDASPRTRGSALRTLAVTLPPQQRFPLLDEAADLLHEAGDRLTLARVLLDLSYAHHLTGDTDRTRTVARRALRLARECEAVPLSNDPLLSARCGGEQATGEAAPQHVLSDAEHRVAVLATQGFTNREISGRLFVTVSTVEQHLTRVYRKLNVTRADLRPRMQLLSPGPSELVL